MIKNGSIHNGKPKRQCKECGCQFVINPTNKTVSDETKKLIDKLLLERISVRIQVIQKAVNPLLCKHLGELWTNAHSH
jgi:hypothetical protein